jgi:enamine deaminase RidA (YjgF/YER057c/UK114 family)
MRSTSPDPRPDASRARRALARLDLALPAPLTPNASFVPTTRDGSVLYVSGQLPFGPDGSLLHRGRLGEDIDQGKARECAARCALHLLAQVESAVGSLDDVRQVLKLHVYVASTPDFREQHLVANGASDLLVEVLGEAGAHARSAFGVASLPFGSPVEVDAVLAIDGSPPGG